MSEDDAIIIKTRNLEDLIKMFGGKTPYAKVGVLASKDARKDGGKTNDEIGFAHEFGSFKRNIPARSFLRMPLTTRLNKVVAKKNFVDDLVFEKMTEEKSLTPLMKKIAVTARAIVLEAFESGGFGSWHPLKPATLAKKETQQILVETQQLRNSIGYEVVE